MAARTKPWSARRRQRGAVAIIVGLSLIALIGALALVLDIGHLYVAKTELQNAADACSLSAVRELGNPGPRVLERSTQAGIEAGKANRVNFQGQAVEVSDNDVTFSETLSGGYGREITENTRYARCGIHEINPKSIALWFAGIFGVTEASLGAEAVARLVPGRPCALPLAICSENPNGPNRGLVPGQWSPGRLEAGKTLTGYYEWVQFPGQGLGANVIADLVAGEGQCDLGLDPIDGKAGVVQGVEDAWNTRFGLYKGRYRDRVASPPDKTGYAYTCLNWGDGSGLPKPWAKTCDATAKPPHDAFADYKNKRDVTHDAFDPLALEKPPKGYETSSIEQHAKGGYRRTVLVPIIKCQEWEPNKKNIPVYDYACVLLLSPISDPGDEVKFEFLGVASAQGACTTAGFGGGSIALVPALVQ